MNKMRKLLAGQFITITYKNPKYAYFRDAVIKITILGYEAAIDHKEVTDSVCGFNLGDLR